MIYLRNNKVNTCYLGDKKLNKIYLGDKLVWPLKKSFDANGHEFVEIAGIKWATMNVGANKVTDYGLYFQWGDTQGYTADQVGKKEDGKKPFADTWDDYKFTTDGGSTFTGYSTDGKTVLALKDDAVNKAWGGSWKMPTSDDFQTLIDAVTTAWTQNYLGSSVNGLLCTDKNDTSKTLFFPACGVASDGNMNVVGIVGGYWSSSLANFTHCYSLSFASNNANVTNYDRYQGRCVRGVLAEN